MDVRAKIEHLQTEPGTLLLVQLLLFFLIIYGPTSQILLVHPLALVIFPLVLVVYHAEPTSLLELVLRV